MYLGTDASQLADSSLIAVFIRDAIFMTSINGVSSIGSIATRWYVKEVYDGSHSGGPREVLRAAIRAALIVVSHYMWIGSLVKVGWSSQIPRLNSARIRDAVWYQQLRLLHLTASQF